MRKKITISLILLSVLIGATVLSTIFFHTSPLFAQRQNEMNEKSTVVSIHPVEGDRVEGDRFLLKVESPPKEGLVVTITFAGSIQEFDLSYLPGYDGVFAPLIEKEGTEDTLVFPSPEEFEGIFIPRALVNELVFIPPGVKEIYVDFPLSFESVLLQEPAVRWSIIPKRLNIAVRAVDHYRELSEKNTGIKAKRASQLVTITQNFLANPIIVTHNSTIRSKRFDFGVKSTLDDNTVINVPSYTSIQRLITADHKFLSYNVDDSNSFIYVNR